MKKIPLVNIRQGSHSDVRFSHGNTLPLTQMPFGMISFAPQTRVMGTWFFQPDAHCLEGVRITHQPSPWIGDHGPILMTPDSESVQNRFDDAVSSYRPEEAVLRPDYIKLNFMRPRVTFELTPGERGAAVRLHYEQDKTPYLSLFPLMGKTGYQLDAPHDTLYVFTDGCALGRAVNFKAYYVLQFPEGTIDYEKTKIVNKNPSTEATLHLAFLKKDVEFKIGSSFIDNGLCCHVIESEMTGTFEEIRQRAEDAWEEVLSRIEIEAQDERQLRTFYSCMYRIFLYPHKAYEHDWDGTVIHYSPCDGRRRRGVRYTDNGFWDTYRTVYPLLSLIAPKEYEEILRGFVVDYTDGGWLPRWPSIGEVGCMPSTLIDAVIADAAVKGIGDRALWEEAYRGMLRHANHECEDKRFGRNGALAYLKYGYVPRDLEKESVNLTLDAAYGDFCIAQVAQVLGDTETEREYRRRAQNYRNLFDPATGFMRGKDQKGETAPDFDPFSWGGEYTEGSAWQSSFAVPHDIEGLAELYGGKEGLLRKLDELFAAPPYFAVGGYGHEIHEMTEMAAVDFGQCAISNQPSFHIPYLYACLGHPEKAHYWVKRMCDELFDDSPDGFPGDEDNGTMAAWYVFSCLGMYPICPGKDEYVRIPKLVRRASLCGKELN